MLGGRFVAVCGCAAGLWAGMILNSPDAGAQALAEPDPMLVAPDDSWLPPRWPASECGGRKTLMQWSYGTSCGGGPNRDEPLVTDRPDFTEASSTVGRGVGQLEFGYTYSHDSQDGQSTSLHSCGEPLLRLGIGFEWLELRAAVNYLQEVRRGPGGRVSDGGVSDLYLGIKLGLTPQEGILPEMAIVPQMFVPIGSDPFDDLDDPLLVVESSDRVLPGVNWLYSWELTERLSLGGSTQFNCAVDDETQGLYTSVGQSIAAGYSFTDRWGGYVEFFGLMPAGADDVKPEYYFNGGPVYLVTENLQLDFRAGVGLNEAADDYFIGSGASVRF